MSEALLLPYQTAWVREQAPAAVVEKSRRIGLSWCDAYAAVMHAAEGTGDIYYQSYNQEMTRTYIKDCADWARRLHIAAGHIEESIITDEREQVLQYRITLDSGKSIQALPSSPRALRSKGKPGDRYVLDEGAFCDDLEALLEAAMAVTIWGGVVRIISTHNGTDNPFSDLVEDIRAGRHKDYALHRVTLDDALAQGLYKKICKAQGQHWNKESETAWRDKIINIYRHGKDQELFCIPAQSGGVYFPRALIEGRMTDAPVLSYRGTDIFNQLTEQARRAEIDDWLDSTVLPVLDTLNTTRRHVIGMDFARSGDMSVIANLAIGERLTVRCPLVVEMHNVPHKQQEQVLCSLCDRLPRFAGGAIDAGGNGSYIAEAAADRYGSIIEQLHLHEGWYRDNIPRYKAALEDGLLSLPKSDDILQDHRAVKLVRGVPRLPAKQTAKGRHGDSFIALALAYYASLSEAGPMEYLSAEPVDLRHIRAIGFGGIADDMEEISNYVS